MLQPGDARGICLPRWSGCNELWTRFIFLAGSKELGTIFRPFRHRESEVHFSMQHARAIIASIS
jgi:hypothetical protein